MKERCRLPLLQLGLGAEIMHMFQGMCVYKTSTSGGAWQGIALSASAGVEADGCYGD